MSRAWSAVLTEETLTQAAEDLFGEPEWMKMLRGARVVEVAPSPYAPEGAMWTMDVEAASFFPELLPERDRGRVMLICHTEDEAAATEIANRYGRQVEHRAAPTDRPAEEGANDGR